MPEELELAGLLETFLAAMAEQGNPGTSGFWDERPYSLTAREARRLHRAYRNDAKRSTAPGARQDRSEAVAQVYAEWDVARAPNYPSAPHQGWEVAENTVLLTTGEVRYAGPRQPFRLLASGFPDPASVEPETLIRIAADHGFELR